MGDAALAHLVGGRPVRSEGSQRRESEQTALYQTLAAHSPELLERAEELGGITRFVECEARGVPEVWESGPRLPTPGVPGLRPPHR